LYAIEVADADAQPAIPLINLGYSIGFYGLLDPHADSVLVDIEEEQLLQCGTLFQAQLGGNHDWVVQYRSSFCSTATSLWPAMP
jgi:hypothetical protein